MISNNLEIDSIELSPMHLTELSHWTSFVETMIIQLSLVWWVWLMLLNLTCILFFFVLFLHLYFCVFPYSLIVAYKLFDKISPLLFISEWMYEPNWIIFLSLTKVNLVLQNFLVLFVFEWFNGRYQLVSTRKLEPRTKHQDFWPLDILNLMSLQP